MTAFEVYPNMTSYYTTLIWRRLEITLIWQHIGYTNMTTQLIWQPQNNINMTAFEVYPNMTSYYTTLIWRRLEITLIWQHIGYTNMTTHVHIH